MARIQTMVQLTDELVESLDAEAARRGLSRSALIREAIAAHLEAAEIDVVGRRIVEGYRRLPPGTPDGWAPLDPMQDRSTRETIRRLDAEERSQGHRPWRRRDRPR